MKRRRLKGQTIVITGASSGIGLATAMMACERGAKVVLASRNADDLQRIVEDLQADGGQAAWVEADVSDERQVRRIAEKAVEAFGGFDAWVNNAGVSMFSRVLDEPLEDARRIFDTNYWGLVHGCRVAVEHLREKGGAIVNIGSVASHRAIVMQGTYSASKHAVKGYTDALRVELEEQQIPVSVTLVKPGGIDTPYTDHARNLMHERASLPPPLYAPEVVARAILRCIEKPQRQVIVGGLGGATFVAMEKVAPSLMDAVMRRGMIDAQKESGEKVKDDGLYTAPRHEGRLRRPHQRPVFRHSLYTWASLHKGQALAAAAAASLGMYALSRSRSAGI